jgi:hypothetical protein
MLGDTVEIAVYYHILSSLLYRRWIERSLALREVLDVVLI